MEPTDVISIMAAIIYSGDKNGLGPELKSGQASEEATLLYDTVILNAVVNATLKGVDPK